MIRLFAAGLFAGGLQTIVVTLFAFLVFQYGAWEPISTSSGMSEETQSSDTIAALRATDLLVALGLAVSTNRFVSATALHLRQASRRMFPDRPRYATQALLVQLTIAAIGSGMLALPTQPLTLNQIADAAGWATTAPFI
jgi:hypothetical protein